MSARKQKKGGTAKIICLVLFLLLVLGVTTGFMFIQGLGSAYKPDDESVVQVTIPEGTPAAAISQILADNGIVKDAGSFTLYSRIHKVASKYQAGQYALSPSMTMKEIADIISTGKVNTIKLTIPEGYTEYDIADIIAKEDGLSKDKFIESLESGKFAEEYSFLKQAQDGPHKLEGYLMPETYSIPAGTSEDDIIRMLLDGHAEHFTDKMRAKAKKMKRSENEIMIVASIIEKECADVEDQPIVASVIYNRLDIGMPLQMDSTIQYILGLEGVRKEDLLYSDTEVESPYNTYTNAGLPTGPICNPGASAIKAAFEPADTDYLYFVLSDKLDGKMAFSKDYNDFLKDKDAYYAARDKAGNE